MRWVAGRHLSRDFKPDVSTLGMHVVSTKVPIEDIIFTSHNLDGTAILRGHPSHANLDLWLCSPALYRLSWSCCAWSTWPTRPSFQGTRKFMLREYLCGRCRFLVHVLDRGYYMAARRYEISLRVLKKIFHDWAQRTSEILIFFNTRREISYLQAAM